MTSALLLALLAPQDLLEREMKLRRRLSPGLDLSAVKPSRAPVSLDAGADFGCGSFDVKGSFRALFDRNVREEFLGGALAALEAELAGSALVLACYASPTVCDALKHYRVSANAMLGMELDACRLVEGAVGDAARGAKARAIKECLDEKARRGVPLDQARRDCQRAAELRDLDGTRVKEIDLVKALGLSESLAQPLTIGAGTLRAEARPTAVIEAYEAKRREAVQAWGEAVQDPGRAPIDALGPLTRPEVERLALMEPARREAVVRSLAAARALAETVKEAHAAERALESGELRATPEVRAELEKRRVQLRAEIGRLVEAFESERRLNAAVAEAQSAWEADVAEKARERLAPRRAAEAARDAAGRMKPWGCEVKR
jgi:hypothetical protein